MRVLYNNGIFSFDASSSTYSNNTTSNLLLSDHWTQWRNWVDLYGNEFYDMARGIPASCCKNAVRMPAQINFDTDIDIFTYFTDQGWLPRLHKTLSGGAIAQAPGILEDYSWEEIADKTFLDVGGGGGGLVALILRKHKGMHAGILDLPKVIDHARSNFHSPDGQYYDIRGQVEDKNLIAGDFLLEIPSFEVYTMKWCLHDWGDTKALKILTNIRAAILKGPESRLIIFESILADGRMGRLSRYGDITMMVSANGQERTETQWRALAKQTGWEINRIHRLRNSWTSAIELFPYWNDESETLGTNHTNGISRSEETHANTNGIPHTEETPIAPVEHTIEAPEIKQTEGLLPNHEKAETNGNEAATSRTCMSQMTYLEPWDASRGAPYYRSAPDEGFGSTNFKWVDHTVAVTDARPTQDDFDLDTHGFAFCKDPKGLAPDLLNALHLNDQGLIRKMYYPQIESLVKRNTGASRVVIFDHTVRKKNPSMDPKANPNGHKQPATVASTTSFFCPEAFAHSWV